MYRRCYLIAAALAALAAPALANNDLNTSYRAGAIALPALDGNGSSDGNPAAADQGHVSYRVPIVTPPGKAGVEPGLALVYGGRGDGVLGIGWSLGLPTIRTKTSGRGGQPAWGVDETYLGLSGEDLIDAGTLGDVDGDLTTEAVFREERDLTFTRYLKLSAGGWRIDYADGRKLYLGTTSATRVERAALGQVARWLPERLEDGSGNQLLYTWATAATVDPTTVSPTERYLTSMRWGCRGCATATAYQEARFTYAKRSTLTPGAVLDFTPGFLVETELYLTSIVTASFASDPGDVRTYALGYDTTKTRLTLTSVTTTTADAALPPVTFAYTTAAPQAAQPELVAGAGVLFKSGVQLMDLDKDGRSDVVDLSTPISPKLYTNAGATNASYSGVGTLITAPPGVMPTVSTASVEDENRDLGQDIVDLVGARVYRHVGSTGFAAGVGIAGLPAVAMGSNTVRADIDNDGYPDLVDTSGAASWTIYFNDGAGNYAGDTVVCSAATTPTLAGVLHASSAGVMFGDINGDGVVDVAYVDAAGNGYVYPGRGRGCWGFLAEDGHGATQYATRTLVSAGGPPQPANLSLADLDGDGFADLVELSAPSRLDAWMYKPATGWSDASPAGPWVQSIATTNGCRIGDVDHDAIPEVLCSNGWKLYDFADQVPFLLASASNGRGLTTTFAYSTSARIAAAHASAGVPWTTNVAAAVPVVASITESDGRGHVLERAFDYRDAYYRADLLTDQFGFVGYGYVAERQTPKLESGGVRGSDPADAGALVRRYADVGAIDYALRGMPTCQETWPGTAVPASFACQGATGALTTKRWTYAVTTDPMWGFVTVGRTAEDEFVAEGANTSTQLRTEWVYDAHGNPTQQIRYGRYRPNNRLYGADERATLTDYVTDTTTWNLRLHSREREGKITAAGGFTQLTQNYFYYDGQANWQVATVGAGLLTKVKSWIKHPITGAQSTITTSTRTYTATGMLDRETDTNGTVTDHDYDTSLGLFPLRKVVDPAGLALTESIDVDSRTGVEVSRTAPDGEVTQAGYDLLGRMTWLARPGATPAAPTVTRSYVDAAPLSTVTESSADGTAGGLVSTHQIDGRGNTVCDTTEAKSGKVDVRARDFSARGTAAFEWAPYRATACDALTVTVAGGVGMRSTTRDHDELVVDALRRPLSRLHSDGSVKTWAYTALAVATADEEDTAVGSPHVNTPTTQRFDGLGRVIGVDAVHLALDDDPGTHSFAYAWDALGNLTRVTDSGSHVVFQASYDSRSRRVRIIDADLGTRDTTFDNRDRPTRLTDGRGVAQTVTYDRADRALTVTSPGGVITYHYDNHQVPAQTAPCHTKGRVAWVTDPSGSEVLCYDQRGNRTQLDKVVSAASALPYTTNTTYDGLDRMATQGSPSGTLFSYTYGDDGRPSAVAATSGVFQTTLVSGLVYRADGQLLTATLGNGVTVARTYDSRQRPTRLWAGTLATTWQDLTLGYDRVGNVTATTDVAGGETASYAYDDLYRLASASGVKFGGATATYRYDRLGNLTRKESTDLASPTHLGALTYGDPVKIHAVTAAGGTAYTYDAGGNLASDGARGFVWTDRNYLAQVNDAAGALIYAVTYDYDDQRVRKVDAGGDSVVYIPAAGAELRTVAGTATWIDRVTVSGLPLARVAAPFTAATLAAQVRYPLGDHLGTPSVVLDGAGNAVERSSTHPWGEENTAPLVFAGTLASYLAPGDPLSALEHRFQHRELDADTGDYDFGARMYRPELGRFLSPDTLVPEASDGQSWNRYAFVRNNPVVRIDPSGHADLPVVPTTAPTPAPAPALPEGHIGGANAMPIGQVPSDRWIDGGANGVQRPELKAATGNDSLGERLMDPLLRLDSAKFKVGLDVGPVSIGSSTDLMTGKQSYSGGVSKSVNGPAGTSLSAGCSTTGTCDVGVGVKIPTGPAPVSIGWKPAAPEHVTIGVGPKVDLAPGVSAGAKLEWAWTIGVERAELYATRLWEGVTGTTVSPTP